MPILSVVARKHPSQVLARIVLCLLLTVGAACVIYPMLLVLGQAMSDEYDSRDNTILPSYLYDRNELALKHIFSFTNQIQLLASRQQRNAWSSQGSMRADSAFYESLASTIAQQGLNLNAWPTVLKDFNDFKQTLDPDHLLAVRIGIEDYFRPFLQEHYGKKADDFKKALADGHPLPEWFKETFPGLKQQGRVLADRGGLGVAIMNRELRADYLNYYSVEVPPPGNFTVPVWRPGKAPKAEMWRKFMEGLPPERKLILPSDTYWHDFLQKKYSNIQWLNAAWGANHQGFSELVAPLKPPAAGPRRGDWDEFIIQRWPRGLLRIPQEFADTWRSYLKSRFVARINGESENSDSLALAEFNRSAGLSLKTWDEPSLPETRPADEILSRYWCEFTFSGLIPADKFILEAPEIQFRVFLKAVYAGERGEPYALANLNAAWKTSFKSFEDIPLPLSLEDYAPVRFQAASLRWRFATEPFRRILEYVLGRSNAARNTLILVLLSLASALTLNPLAAYSLSRFSMKQSHKILIFFLATMAFPAEVAMIPNFLLMRDLGLLNSYAALLLPGMANGFSIFLLKCFFDSLPRELFEAAEIDGAGEIEVFRLVALPLLTPILAYIALSTFVMAYSSFMWAFVICPKEEMWTLMVWVYDFQSRNPGTHYIMAATLLVSIPPLIVFLLANRVIMRGIMIPSMK